MKYYQAVNNVNGYRHTVAEYLVKRARHIVFDVNVLTEQAAR